MRGGGPNAGLSKDLVRKLKTHFITLPANLGVRAYVNDELGWQHSGAFAWEQVFNFLHARWDTGDCQAYNNGFFDGDEVGGDDDRLTIVRAGWYIASATLSWAVNANGERGIRIEWTDGVSTAYIGSLLLPACGNQLPTELCLTCPPHWMSAGDIVKLYAYQNTGAPLSANILERYSVEFGVVRVV